MVSGHKKLLVLYASPNKEGNSACLAQWVLEGVNREEWEVEEVYLYDLEMPYLTNANRKADPSSSPLCADTAGLLEKIAEVDHVLLTYPVWNFGVPAILKNVLDRGSCTGRIWSEEKKKKIAGWCGKRFYVLWTQGAPWFGIPLNCLALFQLVCTLWYFGAGVRLLGFATNSGNGARCVIHDRQPLAAGLRKKGGKYFA